MLNNIKEGSSDRSSQVNHHEPPTSQTTCKKIDEGEKICKVYEILKKLKNIRHNDHLIYGFENFEKEFIKRVIE